MNICALGIKFVTPVLDGICTTGGDFEWAWVNYPGTGNYSQFLYDGMGENVEIIETRSNTVTSTKQFVWAEYCRLEQRNSGGSVISQFCSLGQTISGADNNYTMDHLAFTAAIVAPFSKLRNVQEFLGVFNPLAHAGSVRELTNSAGTVVSEYSYDPFGRVSTVQGSASSDFQYGSYYVHAPSGLNLTVTRSYSANIARWQSRDPLSEGSGQLNLYGYVANNPISNADPFGLCGCPTTSPDTPEITYVINWCLSHCSNCVRNDNNLYVKSYWQTVRYEEFKQCLHDCIRLHQPGGPAPPWVDPYPPIEGAPPRLPRYLQPPPGMPT
jgi:RHS repeat-associated protein